MSVDSSDMGDNTGFGFRRESSGGLPSLSSHPPFYANQRSYVLQPIDELFHLQERRGSTVSTAALSSSSGSGSQTEVQCSTRASSVCRTPLFESAAATGREDQEDLAVQLVEHSPTFGSPNDDDVAASPKSSTRSTDAFESLHRVEAGRVRKPAPLTKVSAANSANFSPSPAPSSSRRSYRLPGGAQEPATDSLSRSSSTDRLGNSRRNASKSNSNNNDEPVSASEREKKRKTEKAIKERVLRAKQRGRNKEIEEFLTQLGSAPQDPLNQANAKSSGCRATKISIMDTAIDYVRALAQDKLCLEEQLKELSIMATGLAEARKAGGDGMEVERRFQALLREKDARFAQTWRELEECRKKNRVLVDDNVQLVKTLEAVQMDSVGGMRWLAVCSSGSRRGPMKSDKVRQGEQ
ncbi:hypothetical protein BDY21DRAFT_360673 [Lineolata rhizophorae]|uniref:BHLH domain-containing protein n=1 Tax=Lineolata rhizophorae TaxID=578093 RepID=A0A6A6PCA5_9PEZI|nr:hypothetical protein BDY21DRAFT_360673 [Lineolata rhizophorae]